MLVGIQAIERLRLADGPHGCAGRLEVWHSGRWGTVCDDGWDLRDAEVACRVLGCGGALAAPGGAFFGEGTGPVWLSELNCRGNEGQLGICPHRGWKAHICSHEEDAGVVCVGQRAANSREDSMSLLDGDSWLALSGELSPSSEEPPITHAPQPAASSQNGPRKKNPRPPKQTKSTRAPVLTNGAPHQERLRLVSGPHGCAGRLEVWHGGRWGTVCDDGWDLRDAAVACRELGCGGALAAPGGARFGPGEGPVWMDDVGCGGGEEALRDCPRSPWGRSNCDHTEDAGLVCTGSAPRLRLADGPHGCAGRLEVWHGGRWGSVCDDAWDLRDAAVACRELGCGGALAAPGGAFFGEGTGPIILDDLRCRGNETALRFCPARPWGQHDCHHREDAGAVCDGMPLGDVQPTVPAVDSNSTTRRPLSTSVGQMPGPAGTWPPPASPTAPPEPGPEAGSPQLRLVAGPSRCSGRLEVWHDGRWGTVCDDSWDVRDSAVVCRELGCGRPRQPDPAAGRFGWGAGPIWLDDVGCMGTEASLSECPAASWGKHNCAHNEDVGVTCTGTPGLDTISDPFSWSWLPGLGRDQDAWLPGELTTKASLTSSVPQKPTKAPGKAPKSTKKWVTKNAKRPTTQPPGMPTTKHSRAPGTPTSLHPTARTSELPKRLTTEAPHRQTSHTTVRLTPRAPWEWTSEPVLSRSTQGPQEVTSEATTTENPQTSLEPSGESTEGSLESSQDPAATPTAGVPVSSGPFRVRLADGPNRCAGRLEVWHAGLWGTVCDDSWDIRDATVACWELGCGKVRPRVGKTHYGPGTGPIWLDDMGCKGSEMSLSDCPSGAWGKHNCDHEEDVVLTCTGYTGDDDYPSWTWDPTSGEDLTKGTTEAARPGHSLSWATTTNTEVLSPATQSLPDTDDQGGYEFSWTWDTPSGRGLSKGTPTTTKPGSTVTTSTSKSPGHPFPVPRARADTGSPRKPTPERRPLPTSARIVHTTSSPASSTSPEPSGSRQTSGSWPQLIPDAKQEGTSSPPKPSPLTPGLPSPATFALSTPNTSLLPARSPELSGSPAPTSPEGLASDSSMLSEVSRLSPTSEPTPGSDTTPAPEVIPGSSDSSDLPMNTRTPTQPSTASHPTSAPQPTTNPQQPGNSHPATSPQPPTNTHPSTSTPATPTSESLPSSRKTGFSSPTKPSLNPELTFEEAPSTDTSQMQSPELFLASESGPSRPSPASNLDPLSTDAFQPPRSQTLHSASDPMVTPDLPISSVAHPSDQPSPDHLTQGPTPNHNPDPFGPCVSPVPPVRVMACEPPALVELVGAVREVGHQLQRLTWALEQDRQERQVLALGLAQLVEAAQGLGQLSETVKRLAEVAWPPSTPVPMTTTTEEEERPLRGDV
ncbi:soluble scavenger receptor cysteine-rich domain-containing protein SSC5D [Mus caroli]|uniref:Soluble scavenger receptor cysteine-rich domain-containing protein SSC5D n=1 Tax=Mus caroli TaxID=10089 RepID=A0A6P7R378_MUSCR|nr:soluble scavenger receptor cysteine-rich domain-containing protein SSC5D [Mus caroli]